MHLTHILYHALATLILVFGGQNIISGEDIPIEAAFEDEREDSPVTATSSSLQTPPGRLQAGFAKKLLQKWGYMQTRQGDGHWEFIDWRSKWTNPELAVKSTAEPLRDIKSDQDDDENSWSSTEKDKFLEGVRSFQMRFNLPVTGDLDARTVELITHPRCAVPDNFHYQYNERDPVTSISKEQRLVKGSSADTDGRHGNKSLAAFLKSKLGKVFGHLYRSKTLSTASTYDDIKRTKTTAAGNIRNTTPALSTLQQRTSKILPNRTDEDSEAVTEIMKFVSDETIYVVTDIVTDIPNITELNSKNLIVSDMPTTEVFHPQTVEEQSMRRRRNIHPKLLQNILRRSKRTNSYVCSSGYTTSRAITWRILKKNAADSSHAPLSDSTDFTRDTLRANVSEAFRRWAEVSLLTFKERNSGPSASVDIWIQFVTDGSTTIPYGCSDYGCFFGSEMALGFHSKGRAYIYFRDDPSHPWSYQSTSSSTRDLLTVAVHEIGHILCLDHDTSTYDSVMSPIYSPPPSNYKITIDNTARRDVKNIYGPCKTPFVAFDWVRNVNGVKKYSTYIFRGNHYWLWENSNKQTRYGDPRITRSTGSEWPGVPSNLQAVLQILPKGSSLNLLYFFAGGQSYLYDQTNKTVIQQGSISSMWPAKAGSSTAIPNDIKAAYYDKRDGNVYFFSSSTVYAYDFASTNKGCCNSVMNISNAFPGRYNSYPALEANIDLAYYSIADRKLYFLKGENYWESTYNPSYNYVYNRVYLKQYNWHEKWEYICDVQ